MTTFNDYNMVVRLECGMPEWVVYFDSKGGGKSDPYKVYTHTVGMKRREKRKRNDHFALFAHITI
jgi:hypothetical protein